MKLIEAFTSGYCKCLLFCFNNITLIAHFNSWTINVNTSEYSANRHASGCIWSKNYEA